MVHKGSLGGVGRLIGQSQASRFPLFGVFVLSYANFLLLLASSLPYRYESGINLTHHQKANKHIPKMSNYSFKRMFFFSMFPKQKSDNHSFYDAKLNMYKTLTLH